MPIRACLDQGWGRGWAGAPGPRVPEGSAEGVPEHLLHEYAQREPAMEAEVVTWDLPAKSKRLVVELLVLAARDQEKGLRGVMSRQARWGIPDRREFEARPVFAGDDGRAFLDTLRQVSARLGRKENLNCPPIMPPAAQNYVRNGAEPMWCFYSSNDGLDILAFKLILEGGSAKVDYVGMHPERPAGMVAARTGAGLVLGHLRGEPTTMQLTGGRFRACRWHLSATTK